MKRDRPQFDAPMRQHVGGQSARSVIGVMETIFASTIVRVHYRSIYVCPLISRP
jgi:hypothetical protein